MKKPFVFVAKVMWSGLLIVVPIYLAGLLILKAMSSVAFVVHPLARLIPNWVPAERTLSLLLVLAICFLVGLAVRTRRGRKVHELAEKTLFERIPGYAITRSLTQRMAGDKNERVWRPAFAEIEKALVPAFIIEEFDDGRFTVFVPSIPAPFSGAVYILEAQRVHPLDVSMTKALGVFARWGSGAKALITGLEEHSPGPGRIRPGGTWHAGADAVGRFVHKSGPAQARPDEQHWD